MASIPLIALGYHNPDVPDYLGQQAKALAVQNEVQQQQFQRQQQPLQLQSQQNQLTLQNQQVKDQQAGQDAYGEWDGKDYNQLGQLIIKHGGSLAAANAATSYGLNQQKTLSEIIKNQGEGGLAKVKTLAENNQIAAGKIGALADVPDDQLAQRIQQTAQEGVQAGWLDPQHAQMAAQLLSQTPEQIRKAIPLIAKSYLTEADQQKQALDAADIATKNAALPGVQADSAEKQAKQQALQAYMQGNPGKTQADFEIQQAGKKKGAEEAAAFPYQKNLVAIRQQVENQFWNNKDAIGKVEQNVIKPFSDQQQTIAQLNSALDQAAQGNSAAAQAVIPKLVGISQPIGSHRYNQAEAHQLASQGNIPQRFEGTILKAINGDQWTPQMISDMRELAKAQSQVAVNSANAQIDNINTLHGTKIGHVGDSASAQPQNVAPEGTIIEVNGVQKVKKGGQWVPQQ